MWYKWEGGVLGIKSVNGGEVGSGGDLLIMSMCEILRRWLVRGFSE